MKPIGTFRDAIKGQSRDDFVASHPVPVLLYAIKQGGFHRGDVGNRTMERLPGVAALDRSIDETSPDESYLVFPLVPRIQSSDEILVGRGDACDVIIGDASVSRRHAAFRNVQTRPTIVDLDATLGTRVNGVLVEPHAPLLLSPADRVTLGEVELYFLTARALFDFVRRHYNEESRRNGKAPGD